MLKTFAAPMGMKELAEALQHMPAGTKVTWCEIEFEPDVIHSDGHFDGRAVMTLKIETPRLAADWNR